MKYLQGMNLKTTTDTKRHKLYDQTDINVNNRKSKDRSGLVEAGRKKLRMIVNTPEVSCGAGEMA